MDDSYFVDERPAYLFRRADRQGKAEVSLGAWRYLTAHASAEYASAFEAIEETRLAKIVGAKAIEYMLDESDIAALVAALDALPAPRDDLSDLAALLAEPEAS